MQDFNHNSLRFSMESTQEKFNLTAFMVSIPLVGLWIFLFLFKKQKQGPSVSNIFIAHVLLMSYFLITQLILSLAIWIVPYFIDPVLMSLIKVNTVFIIFGFILLSLLSFRLLILEEWVVNKSIFINLYEWFFPSSSIDHQINRDYDSQ